MRVDPGATTRAEGTVDALRRGRMGAATGPGLGVPNRPNRKLDFLDRKEHRLMPDSTSAPSEIASPHAVTLLSLGAGVQSTTLALMACDGTLPRVDGAIFADTGWEPRTVYDHLGRLREVMAEAGIPLHVVSNGNLRADAINPVHRYASIPYFVRNPDGSEGMGRRQCTSEYKLAPINRKVRELLGAAPPDYRRVPRGQVAEQWIGFSTDEIGRVSDRADVSYVVKRYPLLDLGMSRSDCERWLRARGWTSVAKSACVGCPFHGDRQWRDLRENHPDEWADAVVFDEAIRKGGARGLPLNGEAFLHHSRLPLSIAPIDWKSRAALAERAGQSGLFSAAELGAGAGGHGVPTNPAPAHSGYDDDASDAMEYGDPDGCSPYGCRSGSTVD